MKGNRHDKAEQFLDFVEAYIEGLLFTEEEALGLSGADVLTEDLFSNGAFQAIYTECADFFFGEYAEMEAAIAEFPHYGFSQAGHDFWLTRNGHGAGFWDRGIGKHGEELTKASKDYGETHAYMDEETNLICIE